MDNNPRQNPEAGDWAEPRDLVVFSASLEIVINQACDPLIMPSKFTAGKEKEAGRKGEFCF